MIPITALALFILVYMWSLKTVLETEAIIHVDTNIFLTGCGFWLDWVCWSIFWICDHDESWQGFASLYPKDSTLYLSGWNLRSQSYDHLHTQSRFSCNCSLSLDVSVLANSFVSLANITAVELFWMESTRSLMYKTNKVGPRTEPCGILLMTCIHLDISSLTLTLFVFFW